MAGETKIKMGEIAQSALKGKALESALGKSLNTPGIPKESKKSK